MCEVCYNYREAKPCQDLNGTWFNNTCYNSTYFDKYNEVVTFCNGTNGVNNTLHCFNYTVNEKFDEFKNITKKLVPSTQEYLLYVDSLCSIQSVHLTFPHALILSSTFSWTTRNFPSSTAVLAKFAGCCCAKSNQLVSAFCLWTRSISLIDCWVLLWVARLSAVETEWR
jgi:hypothetical protein